MLYNVRYEIASSEMMEQNMGHLEALICSEFLKEDPEHTGNIMIQQCEVALGRLKQLNLTVLQIHILLGFSDCDGDGIVPYKEYSAICSKYIIESFGFETQIRKQQIIKMADVEIDKASIKHPAAENLDKIELFRTFKKYDRNMNGTLDFAEYTQCLTECPDIDLTK